MNKIIIKLGLILCVIAVSVSAILAFANSITADIILSRQQDEVKAALSSVLPAEDYEEISVPDTVSTMVSTLYSAKKGGGEAGYCVVVSPAGYGGAITMIVGILPDQSVSGISITEMNETPGLGTKVKDEKHLAQYFNKKGPFQMKKDGGTMDAVSGATISSRAVAEGVNEATKAAQILSGGAK